jgi:hypothetical protein
MAKPRKPSKSAALRPVAGEVVLWASYGSTPAEWQVARVLWAGPEDFLSEHPTAARSTARCCPTG